MGDSLFPWIDEPRVWDRSVIDGSWRDPLNLTASAIINGYSYDDTSITADYSKEYVVNPYHPIDKEDIPEMKVEESIEPKSFGHRYAVGCCNHSDLSVDRILKSIVVMKSKLMMQCMPYKVDRIECRMSPFVKNNIITAYRRMAMYGKKTPFIARFDEYGRRLSDEIRIDTMRGMEIKIVDPDVYGNNYLVFETYIPRDADHSPSDYDADLPF